MGWECGGFVGRCLIGRRGLGTLELINAALGAVKMTCMGYK